MRQPATQVEYTGARRNPGFAQALLSLSRSSATKQYIFGARDIARYPDMTLPICIATQRHVHSSKKLDTANRTKAWIPERLWGRY
jgi:hypothetical protein